jgi:hypothetical protein
VIYWHTSEDMHEVANGSATLLMGASVYLGKGVGWGPYRDLYHRVYVEEGLRVLRPEGTLVVIQTDAYENGQVFARNVLLPAMLMAAGYRYVDTKIWKRKLSDFFQPPFSQVFVFAPPLSKQTRVHYERRCREYLRGIWEFPQTKGGPTAGYPDGLCDLLVRAFTDEGDLVVDPFAGTGRLLAVAEARDRRAIGYEIDEAFRPGPPLNESP